MLTNKKTAIVRRTVKEGKKFTVKFVEVEVLTNKEQKEELDEWWEEHAKKEK